MNVEAIKENLQKVVSIVKMHEKEMDKDGSRFNIFSILNLSSNEVRLHSTFIAELLNIKGTHSYNNQFCKFFITGLIPFDKNHIISNFNFDNYIVEVEKSTGLINQEYTSGGRIDIVITDNLKNSIIIENKIFAGDQANQLLRYYNFDKSALLLYLTLTGSPPSEWSTNNGEIKNNEDFHCLSYKDFISRWLEKCIELSKDKPKVKETISQYLHIIKNYTQQNETHKMTQKIVDLIAVNREFYNSIAEINQSYNLFRQSVNEKFWKIIKEKRPSETICTTENGIEIKLVIEEDNDGFFYGFCLEKDGDKIEGTSESVIHLATIFKEINTTFITNNNYIGWTFSTVLKKFWWLDNEKIFDLNTDTEMINFTDQIINELDQYINEIKRRIK